MSEGSFSETTNVNFFQRMGKALVGALIGIVLFLVSFIVLFWNEGRAVDTARGLSEAGGKVKSIPSDKVDPANNDAPVHSVGEATTDETLTDDLFGVSAKDIKLERKVEMYQYQEKSKTEKRNKPVGGGYEEVTVYSYEQVWSASPIDSQNFHNPDYKGKNKPMPFKGITITAKVVKFGAFDLPPELVALMTKTDPLPATDENAQKASGEAAPYTWKNVGGVLYNSDDPAKPQIGDLKVQYSVVKPAKVSIIAAQRGNTFTAYQPKSASRTVLLLEYGDKSAAAMIQSATDQNTTLTWILRVVGFAMMAIGIYLVLAPMAEFANIVPFLGGFASGVVGFILGVFAFLVAAMLSLVTIAIAWIFYRPLLGIGLLVGAGLIAVLAFVVLRRARTARPVTRPAAG